MLRRSWAVMFVIAASHTHSSTSIWKRLLLSSEIILYKNGSLLVPRCVHANDKQYSVNCLFSFAYIPTPVFIQWKEFVLSLNSLILRVSMVDFSNIILFCKIISFRDVWQHCVFILSNGMRIFVRFRGKSGRLGIWNFSKWAEVSFML